MYQKYKDKTPNRCSFSLHICLSLSPMRYTQVCVFQMRNTPPLFILYLPLEFFPNRSAPTKLLGRIHDIERQEQPLKRTQWFILGNPHEEENPTKLPLYRCIKSTNTKPQIGFPSPWIYISLSYAQYTSECVSPNENHNTSIYILSSTWLFP